MNTEDLERTYVSRQRAYARREKQRNALKEMVRKFLEEYPPDSDHRVSELDLKRLAKALKAS